MVIVTAQVAVHRAVHRALLLGLYWGGVVYKVGLHLDIAYHLDAVLLPGVADVAGAVGAPVGEGLALGNGQPDLGTVLVVFLSVEVDGWLGHHLVGAFIVRGHIAEHGLALLGAEHLGVVALLERALHARCHADKGGRGSLDVCDILRVEHTVLEGNSLATGEGHQTAAAGTPAFQLSRERTAGDHWTGLTGRQHLAHESAETGILCEVLGGKQHAADVAVADGGRL